MFQNQKAVLQEQLKELQHTIDMVNYKCWYYETAKAAGTTNVPQNMPETDVPAAFQKIRQELKQIPQENHYKMKIRSDTSWNATKCDMICGTLPQKNTKTENGSQNNCFS